MPKCWLIADPAPFAKSISFLIVVWSLSANRAHQQLPTSGKSILAVTPLRPVKNTPASKFYLFLSLFFFTSLCPEFLHAPSEDERQSELGWECVLFLLADKCVHRCWFCLSGKEGVIGHIGGGDTRAIHKQIRTIARLNRQLQCLQVRYRLERASKDKSYLCVMTDRWNWEKCPLEHVFESPWISLSFGSWIRAQ